MINFGTLLPAAILLCTSVELITSYSYGHWHRHKPKPTDHSRISEMIMKKMSRSNIERDLRILTREPHVAGLRRDEEDLANLVASRWRNSGLSVEIHPYDVLLSYPNKTVPNYVAIKSSEGVESHVGGQKEKVLEPSENSSDVISPYNAYSPPGEPEGELVYANFGGIEDFLFLNRTIDIKGKICIAKYGKLFSGVKEQHAAAFGCKGLILYSDPKDYTIPGAGVYPESWYLPGSAVRRMTIFKRAGDPLTLSYPAINTAWRAKESDVPLPSIPVTPVGYDDAFQYLSKMGGPAAPAEWQGGLNMTYRLGPGFAGEYKTSKMKMNVKNKNERRTIHNVIGYIRGHVEPDRYVILGNHRDAWTYGSIDPSSATAVMLELARVYGVALKKGWKPRRTIIFCSWAAEEFGLIGSSEWVEEFRKVLGSRAVAYLNVDSSVAGIYTLSAIASPNLKQLIFDVTKLIPNPDKKEVAAGRKYIFDSWVKRLPTNSSDPNSAPHTFSPSTGTDYAPFLNTGTSSMDLAYFWNPFTGLDFYPVYHTIHETFNLMKSQLDPNFFYHQAIGRLWGEIGLRMVDSTILPFNCVDYAKHIAQGMEVVLNTFGEDMEVHGINTDDFRNAVQNFTTAAIELHDRIATLDLNDALAVRAANDQLMQLEGAFIDIDGIEGQDQARHVIFSPRKYDVNADFLFPGLVDSMFGINQDSNQEKRWDEVRRQYSILLFHLGSAASTLRDLVPIKGQSNI